MTKFLLTVIVALSLALPASARLISFSPSELNFGSVEVGDTVRQEVQFRYSGPDSGQVSVRCEFARGSQTCRFEMSQAEPIYSELDVLTNAMLDYQFRYGDTPQAIQELVDGGFWHPSQEVLDQWDFILPEWPWAFPITAISTDQMPFGTGLEVYTEGPPMFVHSGWGIDYASFPLTKNGVITIGVMFIPEDNHPFPDTLRATVSSADDAHLIEESIIPVTGNPSSVRHEDELLPSSFKLNSIFPNPFNSTTRITFSLPADRQIEMNVISMNGNQIEQLANSQYSQGSHEILWNAREIPAGSYFIQLKSGGITVTRQVQLIR